MAIQARDPRTDQNSGATSAQTGAQHQGGFADVAGIDLGNGTHALAVISVSRAASSAGPYASSTQLLAADPTRIAASIVNTDTTHNLYLGLNGATATTGSKYVVAPGAVFNVPANVVAGQVNAIWAAGATLGASILATTG